MPEVEGRLGVPTINERLRRTSERSDIHSEQSDFVVVPPQRRRPPTRSLTGKSKMEATDLCIFGNWTGIELYLQPKDNNYSHSDTNPLL